MKHREKILYFIAGISTSFVAWVTYTIFVYKGCNINISNIISWIITVFFAYFVNKMLVFRSYSWGLSQIVKEIIAFLSSRIVTGVIEIVSVPILLWLGVTQTLLGIDGFWAKFIAGLVPLVLNYIIGKYAVFHNKYE